MTKKKIDPLRSAQMALVRAKNTKPEIIVRQLVNGLRFKYQTHSSEVLGKPDLVFPRRKKIIFVHGCFWHQHSKANCWRSRVPKTRQEFWIPKLEKNVARDKRQIAMLRKLGWKVLVVWECEITASKIAKARKRILNFLRS